MPAATQILQTRAVSEVTATKGRRYRVAIDQPKGCVGKKVRCRERADSSIIAHSTIIAQSIIAQTIIAQEIIPSATIAHRHLLNLCIIDLCIILSPCRESTSARRSSIYRPSIYRSAILRSVIKIGNQKSSIVASIIPRWKRATETGAAPFAMGTGNL
jgi:hypothetical protein